MRRLVTFTALVGLTSLGHAAAPEAALAPPVMVPVSTADAPSGGFDAARELDIGVSAFAVAMGSFLDDPDEKMLYPGFAGFGMGGGVSLTAMWRGWVGLDVQLFNTRDEGTGEIQGLDVTIGQRAWHVPALLKLSVPSELVRPSLFVGPEFVFPGDADVTQDAKLQNAFEAKADGYMAWAFGLGFEVLLPIQGVDLRVPVQLRGSYNPGVGETSVDRYDTFTATSGTFLSEWQWQAGGTLGLAWYFL